MPERDGYIPGVPCWADTQQPDPDSAADFYSGLFGWKMENVLPDDSPGKYIVGRIGGRDAAAVGSIPEGAPQMALWNTYVWVDSADDAASKVKDAGGNVVMEPFDIMEAGRMGVFSDPEGAVFCVWQAKNHKGSGVVNEHGSVNFNSLNTRDAEAAKPFYEAVFGWKTLDLGGGTEFWTLDGYGDHLETITPGIRDQVKSAGGPEGFENVVASIVPIPDDQPDTPAHWSVTFAVDDADAIAKKATELGGKVVVPPFDAPWVRATVLSDPAGAMFIGSKYVEENKDLGAD